MAAFMRDAFRLRAGEVDVDLVGNVTARFPGAPGSAPRVMIFAHMDQIGFVVRQIEPDGFLRVERLGGVPEKVLPGLRVCARTDGGAWLPGVIGVKSHHATPASEKYAADAIDRLYIDIGAESREEALRAGVAVGNPGVYAPAFGRLGEHRASGTSLDDRGGCAVLVELAEALSRHPPRADVFLCAVVQEEFNLRGAMIAARRIRPDVAIGLDACLSGDTPDLAGRFETGLGGGPGISLFNFHGRGTLNGCIAHPGLARLVTETARAEGLPLKRFAAQGIVTDSAYVQLENEGIATVDLCFPVRYTHAPVETCDARDLNALTELLRALLARSAADFDPRRFPWIDAPAGGRPT